MKLPLISVIIPIYKVEKYLHQCLDTVLAQTYKNLEIILVDDGSTDKCPEICDEYAAKDSRIKVIHQNNRGLSGARNSGLEIAKGQYIGFVDSDDYIELDMYEYLYNLISKDNAAMAVCNVCQDEGFIDNKQIKYPYLLITSSEIFKFTNWIFATNKLYRRDFISALRFNTTTSYGEDGFFIFELAKLNAQVALGNQAKYHYRFNQNPNSLIKTFQPSHLKRFALMEECFEYAKQHAWVDYYEKRKIIPLLNATKWLMQIAVSGVTDRASVKFLTDYIKKHFRLFVQTPAIMRRQKLFVICACVNFNLARKILLFYHSKKIN